MTVHNNSRDFNIPLIPMDRSSKQKINKETQVLNDTLDEMDIIDIFRTFHPNAECCSHALQETNSLRRTVQIVEWSKKMLDMISIFLNLLRFDL